MMLSRKKLLKLFSPIYDSIVIDAFSQTPLSVDLIFTGLTPDDHKAIKWIKRFMLKLEKGS